MKKIFLVIFMMLIFLTGCHHDIPTLDEPTTEYKSEYFELTGSNYNIEMYCIPNNFSWIPDYKKMSIVDKKVFIDDEKYLGDIDYGQLPEIKVTYPLEAYYTVSNNDYTFISSLEKETGGYIIKDLETNKISAVIIKQGDVTYLVNLFIDINNEYQPRFIFIMNEKI